MFDLPLTSNVIFHVCQLVNSLCLKNKERKGIVIILRICNHYFFKDFKVKLKMTYSVQYNNNYYYINYLSVSSLFTVKSLLNCTIITCTCMRISVHIFSKLCHFRIKNYPRQNKLTTNSSFNGLTAVLFTQGKPGKSQKIISFE